MAWLLESREYAVSESAGGDDQCRPFDRMVALKRRDG